MSVARSRSTTVPTNSRTESPMEFVGQLRPSGACNLLEVPGLGSLDVDDDEGEVLIGIRPKSSPLPRRRSSVSDEDSEPEPPPSGSRRVSFADAKGLSLVRVKEFDSWDLPKLQGYDPLEGEGKDAEEFCLSLLFSPPLSHEELFKKVQEQRVELESIELLPGTTILKGVIRVLNISFDKMVYVRTTLDAWSSHFDLLAEYIPGSSDGVTDCFSFKLTLVPPFEGQGARVDFSVRYETPVGTFWANNDNRNYVLFCQQRVKDLKGKPQKEYVHKKSCLKAVSQNLSTVENMSSLDTAPSQENVSTGVSKDGKEVVTIKVKQISDSQTGTPKEDQKLLMENSRNYSRRTQRRAARLSRVKDYFAHRDEKPSDSESEASLSGAAQGENSLEMHSDVLETQPIPEKNSESGGFQFASEPLATSSKTSHGVQNETSPAQDSTSSNKSEKSESFDLADSVTLKMGEKDATDISNNSLHSNDEPAPTRHQSTNKPVSTAEDNKQSQMHSREDMNHESNINTAGESDGKVSLSNSVEVSQANKFSFGTVVAPLYHQVFGKVGNESQSLANWGIPVSERLNMADSSTTLNCPHTQRNQTSSSVPPDASENHTEILRDAMKTQESDQESRDTTLNHPFAKKIETSLSVPAHAFFRHAEILQDPAEIQESEQRCTNTPEDRKSPEEVMEHMKMINVLSTDVSNSHIPRESLNLPWKSQEVETAQAQPTEDTSSQIKIPPDALALQTQADTTSQQDPFLQPQVSQIVSVHVSAETGQQASGGGAADRQCVDESNKEDDTGTANAFTNNAYSKQNIPLDALQDWDPSSINDSMTTEDGNSSSEDKNIPVSSVDTVEAKLIMEKDPSNTTDKMLLESVNEPDNVREANEVIDNSHIDETKRSSEIEDGEEVAEPMTKTTMSSYQIHNDMFAQFKDEEALREEPIKGKEEHSEIKDIVTKQDNVNLRAPSEEKSWELMVEEEEDDVLRDKEGSEGNNMQEEDLEEVKMEERDPIEWLENTGIKTIEIVLEMTEEEQQIIEEEIMEETAAVGEEEEEAEDTVGLEEKEKIEEKKMEETVNGEEEDVVEKESEEAEAVEKEKMVEEEIAEEIVEEEELESELEEEEDVAMQEVDTQGSEIEDEDEMEGEEEMDIDLYEEDAAGVGWDDEVYAQEENMYEEILDSKEEILVDEAEIEVAEAEDTAIQENEDEVWGFEVRTDIEGDLSTPVNNVHEGVGEENTGEEEIHLHTEDNQSNRDAPRDRSRDDSTVAEGEPCILADEPESDQTSEDDASTDSLSDDEVELYMRCLRAAQGKQNLAQTSGERNKDLGFGKRPSTGRAKQLPSPLPSISESVDEDQHPSSLQDNLEDGETVDFQAAVEPLPVANGQESINRNVAWWKETFSCSNILKTLLYTTLLVVFLVVAYHYDFLACFGLYLISVFWLCCQGEKQPVKNNNKIG